MLSEAVDILSDTISQIEDEIDVGQDAYDGLPEYFQNSNRGIKKVIINSYCLWRLLK